MSDAAGVGARHDVTFAFADDPDRVKGQSWHRGTVIVLSDGIALEDHGELSRGSGASVAGMLGGAVGGAIHGAVSEVRRAAGKGSVEAHYQVPSG